MDLKMKTVNVVLTQNEAEALIAAASLTSIMILEGQLQVPSGKHGELRSAQLKVRNASPELTEKYSMLDILHTKEGRAN